MKLQIYLILGISIFFSSLTHAFTLVSSSQPRFHVKIVRVDYNSSSCSSAYTEDEITGMLKDAVNGYWNTIPYGGMKMKLGDDVSSSTLQMNDRILAICLSSWPYGSGVLGVGSISSSGSSTGGFLRLNISGGSGDIRDAGRDGAVRVMAHEIGHTIGFGHSEQESALMYYQMIRTTGISSDDEAGFTYLYPAGMGDAFTGCASILPIDKDIPPIPPTYLVFLALSVLGVWIGVRGFVPTHQNARQDEYTVRTSLPQTLG